MSLQVTGGAPDKHEHEHDLNLILNLLDVAEQQGVTVTATRLIKFLYLADVESIRLGRGKLTTIEWIWWEFGPYTMEAPAHEHELLQRGSIKIEEYLSGLNRGRSFSLVHKGELATTYTRQLFDQIIERHKNLSAEELSAVTYDSEPMIEAQGHERGVKLDMNLIEEYSSMPVVSYTRELLNKHVGLSGISEEMKGRIETLMASVGMPNTVYPSISQDDDEYILYWKGNLYSITVILYDEENVKKYYYAVMDQDGHLSASEEGDGLPPVTDLKQHLMEFSQYVEGLNPKWKDIYQ